MAETDKKEGGGEGLAIFEIVVLLIIIFYTFTKLNKFFTTSVGTLNPNGTFFGSILPALGQLFIKVFPTIELLSIFISLLLVMGIIYASFRLRYVLRLDQASRAYQKSKQSKIEHDEVNPKWQRVLNHVNSQNPADWRLAILEADILLGDMLEKMGYRGEGIGEMLKGVERSDFSTIDNAWEAHKIRNAVAHEGADFILTQREAKRVIGLYQSVFEEFHST